MNEERISALRKPPGPVGRWFARAPRYLYRMGLGWLLGKRFVQIEHTGRTSGRPRTTVLEVIRRDPGSLDVPAAWGETSDWFRNISKNPSVRVSTGARRNVSGVATVLSRDDAAGVFAGYVDEHPAAAKALAKTFGLPFDDSRRLAELVPVVRIAFSE